MENVKADIVLEFDKLYDYNDNNGNIRVSKSKFDEFLSYTYIKIKFEDNNEDAVLLYKMISETDEYVEMEYIGVAEVED